MIDWINAVVPFRHGKAICDGRVQYIDREGVASAELPRKLQLRGSYDSGLMIQTSRDHAPVAVDRQFGSEHPQYEHTHVWISGSPKFLQGHNLFGTNDPRKLVELMAARALELCGYEVGELDRRRWRMGDFKLTVLDITEMLDTGSELNASAWMQAAQEHLRVAYRGQGERDGGTLYIGRHSRLWALKLYQKYEELFSRRKAHQLPEEIPFREQLLEYARGTVRAELRLHSMELKRLGLDSGLSWANVDARKVWERYMERIELKGNFILRDNQVAELPRRLRGTYSLWSEGRDVVALLSRRTFYRHRRELMAFGIDITSRPERSGANVVPLLRVVEARPKAVPSWAYGTPLLAA